MSHRADQIRAARTPEQLRLALKGLENRDWNGEHVDIDAVMTEMDATADWVLENPFSYELYKKAHRAWLDGYTDALPNGEPGEHPLVPLDLDDADALWEFWVKYEYGNVVIAYNLNMR